jgi:uncharacterized protein (TIGR02147 family)
MKSIKPNIFRYTDYRKYLDDTFKMARRQDFDFTILKFTKDLGLTKRGHLYQILWGKRNVTPDMSLRITKLLKLKKKGTLYFEYLVMWQRAKSKLVQDEYFKRMCSLNPRLKRMGKKLNKKRRFGRKGSK